jgi:hypothetical protein
MSGRSQRGVEEYVRPWRGGHTTHGGAGREGLGRAVHVHPIKRTLKAPGIKR